MYTLASFPGLHSIFLSVGNAENALLLQGKIDVCAVYNDRKFSTVTIIKNYKLLDIITRAISP